MNGSPQMHSSQDLSDAELMRRIAGGSEQALDALHGRFARQVFGLAAQSLDRAAAEDIVQEVFLVVMRDAGRYDPARAALPTYLYGIARHQTRRRLTRDRQFVAFDGADDEARPIVVEEDPTAALERREELQRLRRAIVSLPRKYREVIVLCDLQDVSYSDAAAVLRCAIGTIRSRLHRARCLLTQKMGRAAHGEPEDQRMTMRCAV